VRLGDARTRWLYVGLLIAAFLAVPLVAGLGQRPAAAAALAAVPVARGPVIDVLSGARGPALIPVLEATGRIELLFGALLGAGLWLSA
jgi:1,4-dihydroxy-2-naphthoate polyprenyltransferase